MVDASVGVSVGMYSLGSGESAVEVSVVDSEASCELEASVASSVGAGGIVELFSGSGRGVAGGCHVSRNMSMDH